MFQIGDHGPAFACLYQAGCDGQSRENRAWLEARVLRNMAVAEAAVAPQGSRSRGGAGAAPGASRQAWQWDKGVPTAGLFLRQPHFQSLLYEAAQ